MGMLKRKKNKDVEVRESSLEVTELTASKPYVPERKKPKKDNTHWLYIAVIIAVIAGIIFGIAAPDVAKEFKVVGTTFVRLITMMIVPVIFCTIVLGIGSVRAAASVGKAGGIALAYFMTMSTFALGIGLVVGNLIQPGSDLNIEATKGAAAQLTSGNKQEADGIVGFIQSIIPDTFFSSLTSGSVLQTLFIALLVGFAVQSLGKTGDGILRAVAAIQKLVLKVLYMVLWLAPIGAFGAMAGVVGSTGAKAVGQMLLLMVAFYITCILFICVVLGSVLAIFTRFNIFKLMKYLAKEYLLIVATSSSESALPNLMRKMEHLGIHKITVGIVVPTGYSFNLDGTAIYLTMSAIFISDAMNKPMGLGEQIGLLIFMMIASKGAAGVSGAGIATLAAGLQSHRPELLDGVGVIVGIDRFMSEARALTNFTGNAVATLLVGTWTHTIDRQRVYDVLNGKLPYNPQEDDVDINLRNPSVEVRDQFPHTPQPDVEAIEKLALEEQATASKE